MSMQNNSNFNQEGNDFKPENGIYLRPGQNIPTELIKKLTLINKAYSDNGDFPKYQRDLLELFDLKRPPTITKEVRAYIAGFIEGEGSLNIGLKKNDTSKFGMYLDPEFSVTQHVNGISNLYLILCYFHTGRLRHKNGSNATMVFTIDNRTALEEKVVPFYESYTADFGVPYKKRRLEIFKKLLQLFKERAHLKEDPLLYEILPLWDSLRMQKGQKNESFPSLEAAQQYVKDFIKKKNPAKES